MLSKLITSAGIAALALSALLSAGHQSVCMAGDLAVHIENSSPCAIYGLTLKTETGSASTNMVIVPGGKGRFGTDGDALTAIILDAGVGSYRFNDLSALQTGDEISLNFSLEDGKAVLSDGTGKAAGETVILKDDKAGSGREAVKLERIFAVSTAEDALKLNPTPVDPENDLCTAYRLSAESALGTWLVRMDLPDSTEMMMGAGKKPVARIDLYLDRNRADIEQLVPFLNELGYAPWFVQVTAGAEMETVYAADYEKQLCEDSMSAWQALLDDLQEAAKAPEGPSRTRFILLGREARERIAAEDSSSLPGMLFEMNSGNVYVLSLMDMAGYVASVRRSMQQSAN